LPNVTEYQALSAADVHLQQIMLGIQLHLARIYLLL